MDEAEHVARAPVVRAPVTPEDADALHKASRTFPTTEFYDVEKMLTSLGIGEAAVTVLSPKGAPTPLAATRLIPPDSLMAALDAGTLQRLVAAGTLSAKYATALDRASAHEIITARIAAAQQAGAQAVPARDVHQPPHGRVQRVA